MNQLNSLEQAGNVLANGTSKEDTEERVASKKKRAKRRKKGEGA